MASTVQRPLPDTKRRGLRREIRRRPLDGPVGYDPAAPLGPVQPHGLAPKLRWLRAEPGWPLVAALALFPLWWVLGLSFFIFVIMAVPMAVHLYRMRPILLPPGFILWALFVVCAVLGAAVLSVNPSGTVAGSTSGRLFGYGLRLMSYLAVTVIMLYVGNLREDQLSRAKLVGLQAWLFLVTVAGGLLALASPTFQFTSPVEMLLPGFVRTNAYVQALVHPAASQVQNVLGYAAPRPKAPFEYTNFWGENLNVLAVWFAVFLIMGGLRWLGAFRWPAIVAVSLVAAFLALYSLNRGLWLGIVLSVIYVAVRLALRRKLGLLVGLLSALCLVAGLLTFTPAGDLVASRLDNGKSNSIRSDLSQQTIQIVRESPIIGFGDPRSTIGSPGSLTIGKSAACPQCGNFPIGSTGQLWFLLVTTGFGGTLVYFGFFGFCLWRYRHDSTPIGVAGSLVLVLSLIYSLVYNALPSPLVFFSLAVALLWRNEQARVAATSPEPSKVAA